MGLTSKAEMRCLVACAGCERQFDAAGLAEGSQFHCACGAVLKVPRFRGHDAAVVRCSSCSAPRTKDASACKHCGADYTLHELDLHTVCPSCMTLISDRARYCHHCATPIVPQGEAGRRTKLGCPACGRKQKMNSRKLGQPPVSILECSRCAGLWLSNEGFELLRERAREESTPEPPPIDPARGRRVPVAGKDGSLYRRCPECQELMNRRNYGRRSGVILDTCREHGIWFDPRELEEILHWIRSGGASRAQERIRQEERQRERLSRISFDRESRSAGTGPAGRSESQPDFIGSILGALFDL